MVSESVSTICGGVDQELAHIDGVLRAYQRIWLIERSQAGVWGVAVVKDLPEHQWPKPDENGYIANSDKWLTIAYRRDESLAKAIHDVAEDVRLRNEQDDRDAEAEKSFTKTINPDPVSEIARVLKEKA